MSKYKIKILKDTPFDTEKDTLSIADFRLKYGFICANGVTDNELIDYLKECKSHNSLKQTDKYWPSDWFEVIESINNFVSGDWIWHEENKIAYTVVHYEEDKKWRPNYCSLEAANSFTDTYRRKATQEEINKFNLTSFCDGQILIGKYKNYYFNSVWKELGNVEKNITQYINSLQKFDPINVLTNRDTETSWLCEFNGLRVGCTKISHDEVMKIAACLNLVP